MGIKIERKDNYFKINLGKLKLKDFINQSNDTLDDKHLPAKTIPCRRHF